MMEDGDQGDLVSLLKNEGDTSEAIIKLLTHDKRGDFDSLLVALFNSIESFSPDN